MRTMRSVVGAGLGLLLAVAPLGAHHSFAAEFDANQPIKLRGTVVKVDWINPHSWIHIDVKGPDGKVERWEVEAGAPNALFRRGWTKNSMLPGTELLVEGYRAKNGTTKANGSNITFTDGRRLFAGSSGTGAPDEAPATKK